MSELINGIVTNVSRCVDRIISSVCDFVLLSVCPRSENDGMIYLHQSWSTYSAWQSHSMH